MAEQERMHAWKTDRFCLHRARRGLAVADLARLSLNTVTLREQFSLAQCTEACARHGIRYIDPWRDKVAELGLQTRRPRLSLRAMRAASP